MDLLKGWWKRIRAAVRPRTVDREMADEVAFHLEMEARKNRLAGMAPAQALRSARIAFGAVESFKEEVRATRGFPWLDASLRDLRVTARGIRRAPGFAAIAIVTLALGIGAATTIFAVVDAVLLRPVPYHRPEQLVHVWETNPEGADFSAAEPNYLDFRDRTTTLSALAAYRIDRRSLTGNGEPRMLVTGAVTASLFSTLGAAPSIGRIFSVDEDRPGGPTRVVVLSHRLWVEAYGADSSAVGRTVSLGGDPFLVIGVMSGAFRFLEAQAWVPLAPDPRHERDDHWLGMVGRMKPGVTRDQVSADLARIAKQIGSANPQVAGWGVRVSSLADRLLGAGLQKASLLLSAAVAVLLLMACANVANLLLARATARQTELSVRIAMGAGRGRLLRQLLTESAVLAGIGAGLGLAGATWAVALLAKASLQAVAGLDQVAINPRVIVAAITLAIASTLGAGLVPALHASHLDVHSTLKRAGRTASSRGQHRLRESLVVIQVALAVMLLVGGGLMMRSLIRLTRVDVGFRTDQGWAVPIEVPSTQYPEEWQVARLYNAAASRIAAIPGIRSVGATTTAPFSGSNFVNDVTPEDRAAEYPSAGFLHAQWRIVSPGYFEAAGVPLLLGRDFSQADRDSGVQVVIVSRTLADKLWPTQSPIGKRLYWGGTTGKPKTVIGVTGDIRDVTVDASSPPTLFLTTQQIAGPSMTLIVRADGPVPRIADEIRRAIWSVDPNLPVPSVQPLAEARSRAIATPRWSSLILGAFAGTALLLAVVGLYGVLSYAVTERTREIGIRVALGARPNDVVTLLVTRGLALTGLGIAVGLIGAGASTRLMQSLLYQTASADPAIFLAAPTLLAIVALVAALLPARRAARIDPVISFRSE